MRGSSHLTCPKPWHLNCTDNPPCLQKRKLGCGRTVPFVLDTALVSGRARFPTESHRAVLGPSVRPPLSQHVGGGCGQVTFSDPGSLLQNAPPPAPNSSPRPAEQNHTWLVPPSPPEPGPREEAHEPQTVGVSAVAEGPRCGPCSLIAQRTAHRPGQSSSLTPKSQPPHTCLQRSRTAGLPPPPWVPGSASSLLGCRGPASPSVGAWDCLSVHGCQESASPSVDT